MASKLLRVLLVCALAVAADESSVQWWTGGRSIMPCQLAGWERLQRRSPLPIDAGDDSSPRVYSWRHDGEDISAKRIATNGSLEIYRKKSGGVEGLYQCSVRHSSGTVLGYPVLLKQTYIEKQFTSHPENRTVTTGQPVAFSCIISSAPEANVTWLKDGETLLKDERFHVLKNQLLILDVRPEDAGLYRCIATNAFANKTRASHRGQLLVQETSPDLQVDFLPLHHEEKTLVPREGGAMLACPVIGWPRPELIWKLTPPGGRTGELDSTGEVLILSHAELDQEGVYTCSPSGHPELVKTFNITISEPVTIATEPKSRSVQRAGTARFSCEASGRPAPAVTWYKDGELLTLAGRRKLLKSATDERIDLVISSVTSEDAGIYQCFASNPVSTASAWGLLSVGGVGGGSGLAPTGLVCVARDVNTVTLSWTHAAPLRVVAYTLHTQPADQDGTSSPGQPHKNTDEKVTLERPLTPYRFQVRAYLSTDSEKNVASDMSETLICQGQGVPIKLRKDNNDSILVSWQEFADQNPGVVQWILQHKAEEHGLEKNITLPSNTVNYTLPLSESKFIRLLGSRSEEWLPQNLTLVSWTSSDDSNADLDDGSTPCIIKDLGPTQVSATWASFKWQCDNDESGHYSYIVCVSRQSTDENCQESEKRSTTVVNLVPGSDYTVWVQARGGPFSQPLYITTTPIKSDRFKNLTYSVVNNTSVLVSWAGPDIDYKLQYSFVLRLPVDEWTSLNGYGNSVLLTELAENEDIYVMVTELATSQNSKVLTIPKRTTDKDLTDISYEYVKDGILISWKSEGGFVVRYAQDLAVPLDQWTEIPANTSLYLRNLDPKLNTYVMVHTAGGSDKSKVLTVPPPPPDMHKPDGFTLYHVLAICIVLVVGLCALAAYCLWRRARRRPAREETAEMKEMTTLSNGAAGRDAGEPLLNGHLMQDSATQIVPKTPNGKMRRNRQYEAAFDVSRSENPDTTLETVVEADISVDTRRTDISNVTSTSNLSNPDITLHNLLDTSRKPEFEISSDFAKLPDDNMNSELNRSVNFSKKVNSKTPTLQPNG